MKYSERLGKNALVPVVVLDSQQDAIPTARALLAGGIDVMEITLRTAAAIDSIRAVSQEIPEMLVGAGTVLTLAQAKAVAAAGAQFIVSPGFDEEMVRWCVEHDITVTYLCHPHRNYGGAAAGSGCGQILPGQCLWRSDRYEGAVRPLRRGEIHPHWRC